MRKLCVLFALGVLGAGLLATAGSAATRSARVGACGARVSDGQGRFGGVLSAQAVASSGSCAVHNAGDPFSAGNPPLLWWGGPVMGTATTGPIVVTPIFWNPPGGGHPMSTAYKQLLTQYLANVAAASGTDTNVFSVPTEYSGSNGGGINYDVQLGTPINDTHPLPANGCDLSPDDATGIYADGSGYNACIDDTQVTDEIQRVITAGNLPQNDYSHIYVMYTAKHVESCFYPGSTTSGNACSINHHTTGYCAYHSMMGPNWPDYGTVYANMAYPIYASSVGYTCGSDAGGFLGGFQSPNHNLDADTEISPTSHEIIEAITDPNVYDGWFDNHGFEIGDDCAYVWGATAGKFGQEYNQVINGHRYLTQEELSNQDFADTGGGCVPSESAVG